MAEQDDLATLKAEQAKKKMVAVDYMLHCQRNGVAHTGYASLEALCVGTVDRLRKDLDKLVKDHVKKYPD